MAYGADFLDRLIETVPLVVLSWASQLFDALGLAGVVEAAEG
jgi:hypothetical protein